MRRLENLAAVERFRDLILSNLGLQFEDSKLGVLSEVIQHRLDSTGATVDSYLSALQDDAAQELAPLAKELTVPETYFFRNYDQFRAFQGEVLPSRMAVQPAARRLHILSAGCATGEEPYSIAMAMLATVRDPTWTVSIRAVDVNPNAIKKARRAHYSSWAFRETTADLRQKWFRQDGHNYLLDETVRDMVSFEEKNLVADDSDLWRPGSYDVVFCRNVMMYFSPEHARQLIARISNSLLPGGFLFLGHAETLRGLSEDFHLKHTHGAFYYERKLGSGSNPTQKTNGHDVLPALPADPGRSDDWAEAIQRASERVEALSLPRLPKPRQQKADAPDMAEIFALLHGDRYTEALDRLRALPQSTDPDVLLLEAMLLAHANRITEANSACQRLLKLDEFNAGAHYILALCREAAGDLSGAMEQNNVAAYLDPSFAMPRLHLGLIARRLNDKVLARRELSQALVLLRHEDAARLLMFGSGFNRQSLLALCESALGGIGSTP